MDREQLDSWLEKGILGIVLTALVYAPLAYGSMRITDQVVLQALACLLLPLWGARAFIRKDYRFLLPPIGVTVIAFVGYALWRYTQSPVEFNARQEALLVLTYAIFFFAVIDNLNRQDWLQIICLTLVFLGMAISCYAIYQFLSGSTTVLGLAQPPGYKGRASGTYMSPNHLGGLLVMILPLGVAFTFLGRMNLILRILVGYATLMMLAGLAVTISRGAWVAAGVSVTLFLLFILRKRELRIPALIVLGVLILGGIFFARQSFIAKYRSKQAHVESGFVVRKNLWDAAIQIWKKHPLFGAGPNHYVLLYPAYRAPEVQYQPLRAHNDYLDALADYGIIGATLATGAFAFLFYGVWRTWKFVARSSDLGSRSSNRTALALGSTLGIIGLLVHGLTDFNFHIPANALIAAVLMALLTGLYRFATERFWLPMRALGRTLLLLAILGGGVYLALQTRRLGVAEYYRAKARNLEETEERYALLQSAAAVDPFNWKTSYALGENLRTRSFQGFTGYEKLGTEAMDHFKRAWELNPYDAYSYMRYGMCLHWLGRGSEAEDYFVKANELDQNNTFFAAHYGWHFFQLADYETARHWLKRSMDLTWGYNDLAVTYFHAAEKKLAEKQAAQ
ncbi:MAG TPA: O-antigen ligase family protein [Methylomirabilota bacterium]|nr:O-antigen ligase family protein [Methylomirabilota bacterium]